MSIEYLDSMFPTDESAVQYLERARWGDKPACPYCGYSKSAGRGQRKGQHRCNNYKCNEYYNVKIGTIFESSPVPLRKWFWAACHMMKIGGIDSWDLANEIGVSRDTASLMMRRICVAMARLREKMVLGGIVEIGVNAFGGIEELKHSNKRLYPKYGCGGKTGVLCMAERGEQGRTVTLAVPSTYTENINKEQITTPDFSKEIIYPMIRRYVSPSSIVCTDGNHRYSGLQKDGLARLHFKTDPDSGLFVYDPGHPEINRVCISVIRNRWKTLADEYHNHSKWSQKYFQQYLDLSDFRRNETRLPWQVKNGKVVLWRRAPTLGAFETFIKCCFEKVPTRKGPR